jgi:hypothetical protein
VSGPPRAAGRQPTNAPKLPNIARSLLKSAVLALLHAGLIAPADAERLIAQLGLADA